MSPAFKVRSCSLFSTAVALALGLQVAPWPTTVQAQQAAPAPLVVGKGNASPITPVARRNQRRNPPPQSVQPPVLQPMPQQGGQPTGQGQAMQQRPGTPQYPKSDVQRELEKLYQENGRAVPEMVDPRTSQPMAAQPHGGSTNTPQQVVAQPQYQQPAASQPPQSAQPTAAPKRKGLFGKLFSKDNAPKQPPVEPPYTPPKTDAPATTPGMVNGTPQYYGQVFDPANSGTPPQQLAPQVQSSVATQAPIVQQPVPSPLQISPAQPATQAPPVAQSPVLVTPGNGVVPVSPVPNQTAATADEGLDAPLYSDATSTAGQSDVPALDFNAPLEQPVLDAVDLGESAPLTETTAATPADPFSDAALFPGADNSASAAESVTADSGESIEPDSMATDAGSTDAPASEEASPVDENPYSGLTLGEDPFANPETLKATAAPRELPPAELAPTGDSRAPLALLIPQNATEGEEPPLVVDQPAGEQSPLRLAPISGNDQARVKQEMIASRKGLKGLKGFCPVALREDRDLVDAHSQFRVVYNSKTYYLSSSQAVAAFHGDPAKYAPAARGCDVIHLAITGEELEGTLDHAVWYKGRLYLFASAETMDTFVSAPSSHATLD